MSEYHDSLVKAAKWIHERKDGPMWWNWPVLTAHNPDTSTLGLPDTLAWNIFTDIASRGLLVHMVNDEGHPVYKLDLSKGDEWDRVMNPPGWLSLWVWKPAAYGIGKTVQLIAWIVSLIIAGWIGGWFSG